MAIYTATYSPEDNKLRLYASTRLDAETYARAKALGFKWAPKQELFVAPMWTPAREDFLIELAGEIEDEDTSLVDRAAERAERFEEYSEKRAVDAERAKKAVDAIADHIPMGQPILVGHHSEKRARKDAERIKSGMRKAVNMWRTSRYWEARAAGAVAAAKYKELPSVRHRRIKGLESDMRKAERNKAESALWLKLWTKEGLTIEQARAIANRCWLHLPRKEGDREGFTPTAYDVLRDEPSTLYAARTLQDVIDHAADVYPRSIEHSERWIEHYQNRIAYERAMLAEQVGAESMGDRWAFAPGGKILVSNEWLVILRVNRSGGAVNSLTVAGARYQSKVGVEMVKDYQAPTEETAAKAKAAAALNPLCNYPGEGFANMTKAQYDKIYTDYKGGRNVAATETTGAHRVRHVFGCFVPGFKGDDNKRHAMTPVYITDAKRKDPPAKEPAKEPADARAFVREFVAPPVIADKPEPAPARAESRDDEFRAIEQALKEGVKVVAAPQLFPTPVEIARRMVAIADVKPGQRVLEPSAGTGRLLEALPEGCDVEAVEINFRLAESLKKFPALVFNGDFLGYQDEGDKFDRVVMNPPFENGADIRHILHAATMLKPGGRLVALCANGPRQSEKLRPLASHWEALPAGSFKESGTGVNVALLVIDAAPAATEPAERESVADESPAPARSLEFSQVAMF